MRIILVITNKIRNKINEFTNSDLNIVRFYDTFQNYFIDVFSILNVLNFRLHSSELFNIQMINNDDVSAVTITENSESVTDIMKFITTSVLNNMKMTLVKQITD